MTSSLFHVTKQGGGGEVVKGEAMKDKCEECGSTDEIMKRQWYTFTFDAGEDEAAEFLEEVEDFRPVLSVLPVMEDGTLVRYQVATTKGIMAEMLSMMLLFHSISYSLELDER